METFVPKNIVNNSLYDIIEDDVIDAISSGNALPANVMLTDNNQTIAGVKTFASGILIEGSQLLGPFVPNLAACYLPSGPDAAHEILSQDNEVIVRNKSFQTRSDMNSTFAFEGNFGAGGNDKKLRILWDGSGLSAGQSFGLLFDPPSTANLRVALNFDAIVNNQTFAFPAKANDTASTLVTNDGTQTLTNKTLTTPIISSISNTGILTLPTSTDTLVGRATSDTLTNKIFDGDSCYFIASLDSSKRLFINTDDAKTGSTLTLKSNQAASHTLNFPAITATDTIASLGSTQTFTGTKTFDSFKIGANGTTMSLVQQGTATLTFSSTASFGFVTTSVSFPATFGSTPRVQLTNQSGASFSGCTMAAGSVTTSGFTIYSVNCSGGPVSTTITVAYYAYI